MSPPEMRRAALAGAAPISQIILELSPAENSCSVRELQEKKLRRLFCFCVETAIAVATLAYGVAR